MSLNPTTQYATEGNLRARQQLWEQQDPPFDLVGWVLGLAAVAPSPSPRVLDVGCGNGAYLREMMRRGVGAVGCDLSTGMLASARPHPLLVNADVLTLPFPDDTFDVVLAPHMLYHVSDRTAAARELRRVLVPAGVCIAVTNGDRHLRALRTVVEEAVRKVTPGWSMVDPARRAFSLENGEAQLRSAFTTVVRVRPEQVAPVLIRDAGIVERYVASAADHYEAGTARPWNEVVEDVRAAVQRIIDRDGSFVVEGDTGAFVCR